MDTASNDGPASRSSTRSWDEGRLITEQIDYLNRRDAATFMTVAQSQYAGERT
jgi:hypothetical protein